MKKTNLFVMSALVLTGFMQSCGSTNQEADQADSVQSAVVLHVGDNSQVSVDWAGIYKGFLPCADCSGIDTYLKLGENGTYVLKTQYRDKDTTVFVEKGNFVWSSDGSSISLDGASENQYLVGENQLFQLDREGKRIEGELQNNYRMAKMGSHVRDVYWKLIELNGQSVKDIKLMKEPFLRLLTEENRVVASGGCNGLGGTFTLDEENSRLSFSQMISTQMACENMEIEQQVNQVFGQVDSYSVANDTLQLFKARMAPLAVYVAVYDQFK